MSFCGLEIERRTSRISHSAKELPVAKDSPFNQANYFKKYSKVPLNNSSHLPDKL